MHRHQVLHPSGASSYDRSHKGWWVSKMSSAARGGGLCRAGPLCGAGPLLSRISQERVSWALLRSGLAPGTVGLSSGPSLYALEACPCFPCF